jgi:DNA-binding transcriptional regulator of glucitol operon
MKEKRKNRKALVIVVVVCVAFAVLAFGWWRLSVYYGSMDRAQELVSAYAAETPLGDRQAEVEQQVQQDLAQMRGTTFFWDVNRIAEIQPEQIVYAMDMSTVTDYLTVERTDNGDRVLTITEGDKENVWVYQRNGKVFLDGARMKVCENWLVSLF